jgi:hypothetical protein
MHPTPHRSAPNKTTRTSKSVLHPSGTSTRQPQHFDRRRKAFCAFLNFWLLCTCKGENMHPTPHRSAPNKTTRTSKSVLHPSGTSKRQPQHFDRRRKAFCAFLNFWLLCTCKGENMHPTPHRSAPNKTTRTSKSVLHPSGTSGRRPQHFDRRRKAFCAFLNFWLLCTCKGENMHPTPHRSAPNKTTRTSKSVLHPSGTSARRPQHFERTRKLLVVEKSTFCEAKQLAMTENLLHF